MDNNGDSQKIIDYVTKYEHIAGTPQLQSGYFVQLCVDSIGGFVGNSVTVRKGQSIGMSSGIIDSVVRYFIDPRDCHPETLERLDGE